MDTKKLEKWVKSQGGVGVVAARLKVHRVTLQTWLSGRVTPSLDLAFRLLDAAKGELKLADLVKEKSK